MAPKVDKSKAAAAKKGGGGGKDDKKAAAPKAAATAAAAAPPAGSDTDFEAGILFSRYDTTRSGVMTAEDFRKMWKDTVPSPNSNANALQQQYHHHQQQQQQQPYTYNSNSNSNAGSNRDPTSVIFEAGQIFSSHDKDGDGKLSKLEFESLIKTHPQLLKLTSNNRIADNRSHRIESSYPLELITGRLLTHYDETANIAISSDLIDQHTSMAHVVVPLLDAYKTRYDRLRSLVSSKILPKKEQLLQIKRQLRNASAEVSSVSGTIERETLLDAEKIIENLRAVESMRQSSISHQSLQIEEELEHIERVVRRVEQANIIEQESLMQSSSSQLSNRSALALQMGIGGGSGVLMTSAIAGALSSQTGDVNSTRVPPRASAMVELIQQFQDICMNIDKISSKQLTVQVEFTTDDFPRETSDRLGVISRCDSLAHAIQVKDHLLWSSIQAQKQAEEALEEERRLSHEYADEVAEWATVAGDIKQELTALKSDNDALLRRNRELIDILRRNNLLFASPGLAHPI